ncbi:MAG: DsrE family protein [Nitrospiraceae bacterium]|nr:DsrE family protein [Nitrospiraceae bacterium]
MKKLALIVTRGAYNNLLQACQLARMAVETGAQVSILFRDEAVARLTHGKIKELLFSEAYRGREIKVREMWRERKLDDLPLLLREIKEKGDAKFSVCRDSLQYFDLQVEQLIPELDEVQKAEAFWKEEVATAEQVLTF